MPIVYISNKDGGIQPSNNTASGMPSTIRDKLTVANYNLGLDRRSMPFNMFRNVGSRASKRMLTNTVTNISSSA